jgi:branched-chain amino acid transport system permease protein
MNTYQDLFGLKILYRRLRGLGIFSAIVLMAPLVVKEGYYLEVLFLCNYYVVLACSWDILSGYTGKVSFGHSLFVGAAGYTGAVLNLKLGWGPWLTLPAGGIVAGLFGLFVGAVTLRLKGPYFGGVTFCFTMLLYKFLCISTETLGGEEGLSGVSPIMNSLLGNYYFSAIFMLAVVFLLYFISKSSFGIILRSIGENETASEGSGINTTFYKVAAFTMSGTIAGVAGAMYTHIMMHATPAMAHEVLGAVVLMMAVVGGMGTIIGPIIGGYTLTIINEAFRFMGDLRLLIYTGLVFGMFLFAPKGLYDILIRVFRRVFVHERKKAAYKKAS